MFEWLLYNKFAYVVHLLVIIGLLGLLLTTLAKKIKISNIYTKALFPVFFALFSIGLYYEGMMAGKKDYVKIIETFTEKIKVAEEKSAQVNDTIHKVYVDRIKVIKETGEENVRYIEKIVTKYDNLCILSNSAILLHDSASQNEISRGTFGSDEGTSNVKISELLRTVADNYSTYYQTREQIIGWQQWYTEQKKIFESVK
jgi:hypothetical protein